MAQASDDPIPTVTAYQPVPLTMRAALRRTYGGPDQVTIETVPRPEPGAGEVLVRVRAAGLDRATLHLLTGLPYLARLALGVRRPTRAILGQQVAGEVVAVGAGDVPFAVGARVFGTAASGSFAEYAVATPARLAATPAEVTDVDAATIGVSGVTAGEAVLRRGQVQAGQRVLVLGASGAVGSFAVQLAAHLGAQVTGVCSGAKLEFVRGLGARHVADYRTTALADLGGGFDLIVDIGGNRRVSVLRAALAPAGRLVIVGGEGGGPMLGGIQRNLVASVADRFTARHLEWFFGETTTAGCAELGSLIAEGTVSPAIDRRVGLDGVVGVIEAMQRGELRGQAVVVP